jgi:uncharacterized protein with von Willebrand factor type A (vWA) domain
MALLDRHIGFVEALRAAGLPVSLSEDLDSVTAVDRLGLDDRETLRAAFAATLVKRQTHRSTFDSIFDLYFPVMLGRGARHEPAASAPNEVEPGPPRPFGEADEDVVRGLREQLLRAMMGSDEQQLRALAVASVEQLGAMPGRGPGLAAWSSYNTMRSIDADTLVLRLAEALMAGTDDQAPRSEELAMLTATHRVDAWRWLVESDVRRRVAEDRGPEYVVQNTVRPPLDRLDFTAARRAEVDEMRRQLYPLARRLATRVAMERHGRRRGSLDFRHTIRASMSTGGVPVNTVLRPKRPHRSELVVLCDVSGSVANFAAFTLMLVYALQEQFTSTRTFTFVDTVHEVTHDLRPGSDPEETMAHLVAAAQHASVMGRTDYGRAFRKFAEEHRDALTPKSTLLILGDGRSNYTDPALPVLEELVGAARHAWWLNPEHPRQWGVGDSAADRFGQIVPMVECRNLSQLTEFVHDLV